MVCTYCTLEMCFMCDEPKVEQENCCCEGTYGRVTLATIFDQNEKKLGRPPKEPKELKEKIEKVKEERVYKIEKGTGHLIGRPTLTAEEMKDPVGSGRRRAERLTPIPEDYLCEWTLLQNAGGGVVPIVGCAGNMATDRHHSPDKSTLNNHVGLNLHRICTTCHSRWHALNDPMYGERPANNLDYFPLPEHKWVIHDRLTRATPEQVQQNEAWWKVYQPDRTEYRSWEKVDEEVVKSDSTISQ